MLLTAHFCKVVSVLVFFGFFKDSNRKFQLLLRLWYSFLKKKAKKTYLRLLFLKIKMH